MAVRNNIMDEIVTNIAMHDKIITYKKKSSNKAKEKVTSQV